MTEETVHPAAADLDSQLRRLETITDPASRSIATDLIASVLQFHTAALQRMLAIVSEKEGGDTNLAAFNREPLVRSMLLVHDLHPESMEQRVRRAIDELRPLLDGRSARLELLTVSERVVKVRLASEQSGGRSLGPTVERALREAAPDATQIIVEEPSAPQSGFVPLESLNKPVLTGSANLVTK